MMKVHCPILQLKVLVNGKYIQEYHKDQQTFVEGRKGSNFELSLNNLSGRRILVHPTVDGLSCMTGEEASRNDHDHGYVLQPYQEMKVPGWRLDNDSVARFFFAGEGKSYAEKTGRPLNKGVIAAAVWEEKRWYWCSRDPIWFTNVSPPRQIKYTFGPSTNDADHSYSCFSVNEVKTSGNISRGMSAGEHRRYSEYDATLQNLGTGFGKQADHQVYDTHFTPEQDEPNAIAVIYYDDYRGLQQRGIRVNRSIMKNRKVNLPNPFPKSSGCIPPDGWRR